MIKFTFAEVIGFTRYFFFFVESRLVEIYKSLINTIHQPANVAGKTRFALASLNLGLNITLGEFLSTWSLRFSYSLKK